MRQDGWERIPAATLRHLMRNGSRCKSDTHSLPFFCAQKCNKPLVRHAFLQKRVSGTFRTDFLLHCIIYVVAGRFAGGRSLRIRQEENFTWTSLCPTAA